MDEYLIDLNATQAAIRAGYSQRTAHSIGWENLKKPQIQTALQQRREQLAAERCVTPERIIDEYAKIAFMDPAQFFNEDGHLKPISKLSKDFAGAIGWMDVIKRLVRGGHEPEVEMVIKIKFADKIRALDGLSKHLGLFEKGNQQKAGLHRYIRVRMASNGNISGGPGEKL